MQDTIFKTKKKFANLVLNLIFCLTFSKKWVYDKPFQEQEGIFIQEALQHTKQPFQVEGEDPREDYKQIHFPSLEI